MSGLDRTHAGTVRVWDWPTRAFHWLFVSLIVSAWLSFELANKIGDPTLKWHRWNGYAILVLLVFRLIWGVVGSSTARWASFVRGPGAMLRYGLGMMRGEKARYLGHNPLGTAMILVLLAAVATQAMLGLFSLEHNEITAGPLKRLISDETAKVITDLHVRGFNMIIGFAAIHVLANAGYGMMTGEPLIQAMVTGRKPAEPYVDATEMVPAPSVTLRALVVLAMSIGIVFGGITLAGGRIF
ncbi:cytochrome b/b6 domain-containing protein [Rhabdaerophilum sp. SD176]|uniref:cytochrome b/b6 domain-containing protein n=1 Tax=Rhabdaerophilum sp. SD176 TaxID=2983548 RepID=UPI0024DF3C68|nr:cytochrome b/b6 domain-containing protein [Rhabdaerophilum sp. SD176]